MTLAEDAVRDALRAVIDPELGLNIVDLGLIYGVRIEGGEVRLSMTMTSMGCPFMAILQRDVTDVLMDLENVQAVGIDWTFSPPWTVDRVSEEARFALESMGMQIPKY